jgi:hypothetical protein
MKRMSTTFLGLLILLISHAQTSFWLNYATSVSTHFSSTSVRSAHLLFPDTLVKGFVNNDQLFAYASSTKVNFHLIGNVFDPLSPVFQSVVGSTLTVTTPYTVDSLGVGYQYRRRHSDPTIVDTMVVYYYTNNDSVNLPQSFYTGTSAAYGTDTVHTKFQLYSYMNNRPISGGLGTVKVPLTSADETGDGVFNRVKYFSVPTISVNAGRQIAIAVGFLPGYTYAANDTITANKNYFSYVSQEQKGPNTFPSYIDMDWNVSGHITRDERYNTSPYNGLFIPTWPWAAPWQYEQHHIYYHVIAPASTAGIAADEGNENFIKVFPNPANLSITIDYSVPESETITWLVSDISGKVLLRSAEGTTMANSAPITINTATLGEGSYFITLQTKQGNLSRQFIVLR